MRPLLIGLLLAVAALLGGGGERAVGGGGTVARCSALTGDTARACYRREVSASLGAAPVRGVEFVTTTALVCDLHARNGAWQ